MAVELYRTTVATDSGQLGKSAVRRAVHVDRNNQGVLPCEESMAILHAMTSKVIRATYALDSETVRLLCELAERQGTSKSEAIRRAVRLAAERAEDEAEDPAAVLQAFQKELALTPAQAAEWIADIRAERDAGRSGAR